jgi:hypothetical protein
MDYMFRRNQRETQSCRCRIRPRPLKYNVRPQLEPGRRQVRVVAGMCRVEHIALGCSAIQRGAFELLISSGIVGKRPDGFLQTAATKDRFTISEPHRVCRRLIGLSYAARATSSDWA